MTTESIEQRPARASLWRKLAAVTAAVPPVRPTGFNNDIKKKYADSDDIVTTLRPLLAEHQLAITLQINAVRHAETGQKTSNGAPFILTEIDCTFIIADGETGETLAVPWSAEAADHMKDKGLPKALTIARRTFFIHTFHIIAEEEKQLWGDEQQSTQRQASPQRPAARQAPAQQPAPAQNGASYEPPAEQPAPGTDAMRARMLARIGKLTEQAVQLDLEIKLLKPLDQMTDAELTAHGKALAQAIEKARRPGRVPSEPLPTTAA